jgi:hypothetical protein
VVRLRAIWIFNLQKTWSEITFSYLLRGKVWWELPFLLLKFINPQAY